MPILYLFAFVSGLVTIAAPCIWPLLPIVLSASSTGGHRKPFGVTLGILLSFGFFTLTISYIIKFIPINLDALRLLAVVIIASFGIVLIVPKLSQILEGYVSRFSGRIGVSNKSGFVGGLITGISLGIVWTPCAGPILATIATLAATTQVNSQVVLVTIFYLIGVGIPLLIFATAGRNLFTKTRFFSKYTGRVQQIFGIVMILTAILIFTNQDKILSARLLDIFPSYTKYLTAFENQSGIQQLKGGDLPKLSLPRKDNLFNANTSAPEFVGINNWLNSKPLTIKELRGRVVLIDFWTYTCINCIRTLPHVTSWYEKYKDQGFVVVGVHTPEFEFEKNTANVENAIKQYKIFYPVAQDNNYSTWNAYSNQYWPAEYLIDTNGTIRRTHFGEGEYDQTEMAIQALLKEAGKQVNSNLENMPDQTPKARNSPETYLGARRMQYLYPNGSVPLGEDDFKLQENIPVSSFTLGGRWKIEDQNAVAVEESELEYKFNANKVFLVLKPSQSGRDRVRILLDGKPLTAENAGSDASSGVVIINQDRLYNLIDLKGADGVHLLRLEFENAGTQAFAFTFG